MLKIFIEFQKRWRKVEEGIEGYEMCGAYIAGFYFRGWQRKINCNSNKL